MVVQSLRSRGIRFPGRDNESLAPIFTPPRSVSSAPEADVNLQQQFEHDIPEQFHHDVPVLSFTPEQTKEALDVARNSIELLSTVLSSSPQQDALQVYGMSLTTSSSSSLVSPVMRVFFPPIGHYNAMIGIAYLKF